MDITGTLNTRFDEDWVRVQLSAGTTYRFTAQVSGTEGSNDSYSFAAFSTEDDAGIVVDAYSSPYWAVRYNATYFSEQSGINEIVVTPYLDSVYYLSLAAQGYFGTDSTPADYTLSVTEVEDDYASNAGTTGTITVGGETQGQIETAADNDWITAELEAGVTYRFSVSSAASSSLYLELFSNGQTTIAYETGVITASGESVLTFTPKEGGTYHINVAQYAALEAPLDYTLALESVEDDYADNINTSGLVAINGSVEGRYDTEDDTDLIAAQLLGGQSYRFTLQPADVGAAQSAGLSLLSVEDGNGTHGVDSDDSRVSQGVYDSENGLWSAVITPQTDATYYAITGASQHIGDYTLSLTPVTDDYADNTDTAGSVAPGASTAGTLEQAGDHDWFSAQLTGGNTYRIKVVSEGGRDATLADLLAGYGIPTEGMSAEEMEALLTQMGFDINNLLAPLLAEYSLSGYSNNDYNGFVDEAGRSVLGILDTSTEDDGTQIIFSPRQDSEWFFDVSNDAGTTGGYTLSVETITDDYVDNIDTSGTVSLGSSATGRIDAVGDKDWFAVELSADTTYRVNLQTPGSDNPGNVYKPHVTVYSLEDSDGYFDRQLNEVAPLFRWETDYQMGKAVFTPMNGGTYYIEVDGALASGATDYTLSIETIEDDLPDHTGTSAELTFSDTPTNTPPTGSVQITGTPEQGQTLSADTSTLADADGLGTFSYQWYRDGIAIGNEIYPTYGLTMEDAGASITVTVSFTDGGGTEELLTSETAVVEEDDHGNSQDSATPISIGGSTSGEIEFTGDKDWFSTELTAGETYLFELLGYRAQKGTLGEDFGERPYLTLFDTNGYFIDGTAYDEAGNDPYYYLTPEASGTYFIRVSELGDDDIGTYTLRVSTNHLPSGTVEISGDAIEGYQLSIVSSLYDPDGLGTFSYQWQADGVDLQGATGEQLLLTEEMVGKNIGVKVRYTDGRGTTEEVFAQTTPDIEPAPPALTLNEAGSDTLDVVISNADLQPGFNSLSLRFTYNASEVSFDTLSLLGGGSSSLSVSSSILGGTGTVELTGSVSPALMQDDQLKLSFTTSAKSGNLDIAFDYFRVGSVYHQVPQYSDSYYFNSQPTGSLEITGTLQEGNTLFVANFLSDVDGLGTFSYQWFADGVELEETGDQLTLTRDHAGKQISVMATYTDGQGFFESIESDPTPAITHINIPPEGTVTITGDSVQGATLSAEAALSDFDGLGAFSYQWLRDGEMILGANESTLILTQEEVDADISVWVSYTDGMGTSETVSSEPVTVSNINDMPSGTVTISGEARQGQTLALDTTQLHDPDGLGELSYQWLRDGSPITGATASSLVLTEADIGAYISAEITYTDGFGTAEKVTSESSAPVAKLAIEGRVIDGYIEGASIYIDSDGDGTPDPEELTDATTDNQGRFSVESNLSGSVIAIGGTNTDTGLANNLALSAPAGAGVITPITTLIDSYARQSGANTEDAQEAVETLLGFSTEADLLNYDPFQVADSEATQIQKTAAALAALGDAAHADGSDFSTVVDVLTHQLGSDTSVDLADSATLTELFRGALPQTLIEQAAVTNAALLTAEDLDAIAQTQQAAEWTPPGWSDTEALVYQMYIAYYQRPADPNGLKYWTEQIDKYQNWQVVSGAFGAPENAENQALYGDKSRPEIIAEIYRSAFNREGVDAEINYWSDSEHSLTNLAFAIVNGAQNDDAANMQNKMAFSARLVELIDPTGSGDPAQYTQPFNFDGIGMLARVTAGDVISTARVTQALAQSKAVQPVSAMFANDTLQTVTMPHEINTWLPETKPAHSNPAEPNDPSDGDYMVIMLTGSQAREEEIFQLYG
ncbi:hypothetical protein [Marinobacterium litorale]|uniref:hypothetical protein n=1 Tax=Marinobacterium litorale TaxID=404770 RepID=UPI0003F8C397|nr:hypothetical protein [Marinobacterium litorale]